MNRSLSLILFLALVLGGVLVLGFLSIFPPLVTARAILEPHGRWEAAEAEIRPMLATMYTNSPTYLVAAAGTKRA